jgi:phosphoglycolate phosphatase-like HAD superfamily hydrolase
MTSIYFDLDGTLTDPKLGITRSIQYALRKLDRRVPPEDELMWCIGPPLRDSLKKLLGTDDLAVRRWRSIESDLPTSVYSRMKSTLVSKTHCLCSRSQTGACSLRPANPLSTPSALSITSN